MKKLFLKLHLWLAVPFGIIVTIICFTGAMLVLEPDIVKIINRDMIYTESPRHTVLSVKDIVARVKPTLAPDVEITGVTMYSDPELACKVNLSKPRRVAVYVDQYTGGIKGKYERPAFFDTMQRLHRWLLDSPSNNGGVFWGRVIVGTSTIIFVLLLLSGIVIWWPKTLRGLRNGLKITVNRSRHLFWRSLHAAGGMYALVFLLVMALTGLTWSFKWYSDGFNALFGVHKTEKGSSQGGSSKTAKAGGSADGGKSDGKEMADRAGNPTDIYAKWQDVYNYLRTHNAGYEQITVSEGSADVSFGALGNQRAADKYKFDNTTGRFISASIYSEGGVSSKINGWIWSVHTGRWGGLLTRLIWLVAVLIGTALPLTGYYLWIRRLLRRSR